MNDLKLTRVDLKTLTEKQILQYIKTLDLAQSNKLPREEEFAKLLGVSRVTLRAALDSLESRGVIFRRHGKGTFVNPLSVGIQVSLNPAHSFFHMIRNSGDYTPTSQHVSLTCEKADKETAQGLGIEAGDPVVVCKKLFWADDTPCAFIVDYLRAADFTDEELSGRIAEYSDSIFRYLYEKDGTKISWDKVEIDTVLSTDLPDLGVFSRKDGSPRPLLVLRGTNYDEADRPMIYSYEYVNTRIIHYNQIRKRELNYGEFA